MTIQRILATSGGFVSNGAAGVVPGATFREALRLTGADRPKVCFVMTATGDDRNYLTRSYEALTGFGCDITHLEVYPMPNADPVERLCGSDLVWVGGGSVANLLALWRLHGVDDALRQAWEGGTVLGGVSAGSICWHLGGPTDSFGAKLQPITNGLGFLPYGNGVHYDGELQRRPLVHKLVGNGTLPVSYATDDYTGILYEGIEPVAVIADREGVDPTTGSAAYRVELVGGSVVETRLPPGTIR
ncbi:MAG: peptidase E [Actinomycetes bacterium]